MNTPSYIPGKDAPLEATIQNLQAKLQALGFHIEVKSWLNPVEGIWSVHLRDRDCPALSSNGKGASRLACLASALGEFFERLSTNYFWTHFYWGPEVAEHDFVHYPQERWFDVPEDSAWPTGILNPALHAFYNPEGDIPASSLVEFNSGNEARGICTIPFVCQRDGSTVFMPVNIIGNLYASNGMSSGNTAAEARTQALAEVFQRHILRRIVGEGICLPDVPEAVVNRYPRIAAGVAALRAAGLGILVKDASLGGQYPVVNVSLLHPEDQGCLASFGAHPRFEVALERALTVLMQGRTLDTLTGFAPPTFDLEEAASAPNIESHFVDSSGVMHWRFLSEIPDHVFVDWNFSTTTTQDHVWLVNKIHQEGFDIYVSDFEHLGVYGCRMLVPGMSEIYPVDDLNFENNSVANSMREAILNLTDLDDRECEDLLASLNESGIADPRSVAAVVGLLPDAGTFWADLRVGELKTLLALASGNEEATLEGCEWIRHMGPIAAPRRAVYACVETLIQLSDGGSTGPYLSSLRQLYGAAALGQAQALIAQTDRFMGISAPGLQLEGCAMHQKLLRAYAKVQAMKALARGD